MEVRNSTESDQFDPAGYGPQSVTKLVQDAFTQPLALASMVRLSFVVGGGKKVRQKYNEGLEKHVCDALKGIGFVAFHDTESVDKAVTLGGENLDGRPIRLDYAGQKKEKPAGAWQGGGGW